MMTSCDHHPEILVRIEENALRARLVIPEALPTAYVDESLLTMILRSRGVVVDDAVQQRLCEVVREFKETQGRVDAIVAEATPPVAGEDGSFEWAAGCDPTVRRSEVEGHDDDGRIDHYNQVRYIHVAQGQHVATLKPPTRGEPGRDVRGESIPPQPGKPTFVQCAESIALDEDGVARAKHDGMLQMEGGMVSVSRILEVRDFADFTTGNIDFDGTVHIHRGVRDRFTVKSSGDIIVDGLVEAANIITGRDFTLRTGMTGREQGRIDVGRDANAVYLNQVAGVIRRDLRIMREIISCRLTVGGELHAARGAIIGGAVSVGGSATVAAIGSGAGVETEFAIGDTRQLEATLRSLQGERREIEARCLHLQTLRDGDAAPLRSRIEEIESETAELIAEQERRRRSTLMVCVRIFPRAVLRIGSQCVRFEKALNGPVWIGRDASGMAGFRHGSGPIRPLSEVTRAVRRAA